MESVINYANNGNDYYQEHTFQNSKGICDQWTDGFAIVQVVIYVEHVRSVSRHPARGEEIPRPLRSNLADEFGNQLLGPSFELEAGSVSVHVPYQTIE